MNQQSSISEPPLGGVILQHLQAALRNRTLYPAHHPEVLNAAVAMAQAIAGSQIQEGEASLAIMEGQAYLNGLPLRNATMQYTQLLGELISRGVEVLRFQLGVSGEEVSALVEALTKPPEELEASGGLRIVLDVGGVRNITVERLVRLPDGTFEIAPHGAGSEDGEGEGDGDGGEAEEDAGDDNPLVPSAAQQRAFAGVIGDAGHAFDAIATQGRAGAAGLQSVIERLVSEMLGDTSAFLGLLHLRTVGEDLFQHAINTSVMSVLIGSKLEMEEEQLRILALGAMLHDVGELYVPRDLRRKPGPLTPEEWRVVQKHPSRGAKLLLSTPGLDPVVATVALEHHVGVQGKGYPSLRSGQKMHLFSRIVAIADAYDSLAHPRPYQKGLEGILPTERLLQLSGSVFDPTLVKLLLHSIGFYPPGTPVRLSDGREGVVEAPTPGQPFLPRVLIQTDETWEVLDTSELNDAGRPSIIVEESLGPSRVPAPRAESILSKHA